MHRVLRARAGDTMVGDDPRGRDQPPDVMIQMLREAGRGVRKRTETATTIPVMTREA